MNTHIKASSALALNMFNNHLTVCQVIQMKTTVIVFILFKNGISEIYLFCHSLAK